MRGRGWTLPDFDCLDPDFRFFYFMVPLTSTSREHPVVYELGIPPRMGGNGHGISRQG